MKQQEKQLPLAIKLHDEATFLDFNWVGNELLRTQIQHILSLSNAFTPELPAENSPNASRFLYLWGPKGSGKSHLLQAACQSLSSKTPMYLPLKRIKSWGPMVLESLEEHKLLCIDDIEEITGDRDFEEALFHRYNRIKDTEDSLLIISGTQPPALSPLTLADLRSRLVWGLVIQVNELSDEEKINTLQVRALKRGFILPDQVLHFLIHRCARNMHDLDQLLNHLDDASLAAHKKISIPFVKEILKL